MNILSNIFKDFNAFLLGTALLTSCAASSVDQPLPQPDPDPMGEETVTLTIDFPVADYGLSTRAATTTPTTDAECVLNDLYLVIFRINPNTAETELYSVTDIASDVSPLHPSSWKGHRLSLPLGIYKFYALANLSSYISGDYVNQIKTEAGIKSLVLQFTNVLEAGKIPMACMAENVRKGTATADPEPYGEVEITESTDSVYMPLDLLCAKVRYTILFDNTESGFSKAFSDSEIKVTDVSAFNITDKTPILGPAEDEEYLYPTTETGTSLGVIAGVKYPDITKDSEKLYLQQNGWDEEKDVPDYLSSLEGNDWTNTHQRAWQGVAYFPENLSSEEDDTQTQLLFEGIGEGFREEGYTITIGELQRGYFYDVVGKLVNPSSMAIKVMVKVNAWAYTGIDVTW